jgi:hypothetical protein
MASNRGRPAMSRSPLPASLQIERTSAPSVGWAGAGRRCRPRVSQTAETAKVAASSSRAPEGERVSSSAPPSRNPISWDSCCVMPVSEVATAYRSPSSTSAISAARAASNGGAHTDTSSSNPSSTGSGTPGTAMTATSPARATSLPMSTRCRGSRSASAASTGPATSQGR